MSSELSSAIIPSPSAQELFLKVVVPGVVHLSFRLLVLILQVLDLWSFWGRAIVHKMSQHVADLLQKKRLCGEPQPGGFLVRKPIGRLIGFPLMNCDNPLDAIISYNRQPEILNTAHLGVSINGPPKL